MTLIHYILCRQYFVYRSLKQLLSKKDHFLTFLQPSASLLWPTGAQPIAQHSIVNGWTCENDTYESEKQAKMRFHQSARDRAVEKKTDAGKQQCKVLNTNTGACNKEIRTLSTFALQAEKCNWCKPRKHMKIKNAALTCQQNAQVLQTCRGRTYLNRHW